VKAKYADDYVGRSNNLTSYLCSKIRVGAWMSVYTQREALTDLSVQRTAQRSDVFCRLASIVHASQQLLTAHLALATVINGDLTVASVFILLISKTSSSSS